MGEVFFHGAQEEGLEQQLADALFHHRSLGDVERAHPQDVDALLAVQSSGQPRAPLARVNDIHLMTRVAELPHQVGINPARLNAAHTRRHRQKQHIHIKKTLFYTHQLQIILPIRKLFVFFT